MKIFLRMMALILLMLVPLLTFARRENSGWIVFHSNREGDQASFMMTDDGSNVHRISTNRPACEHSPRFSPDGVWLAALDSCAEALILTRVRPGGASMPLIVEDIPQPYNLRWSPDSQRIAVTYILGGSYRIEELYQGSIRLLRLDFIASRFSPDGEWLYMQPAINDRPILKQMHIETGQEEDVLSGGENLVAFDWSPDGEQIAFVVTDSRSNELYFMNADGSARRSITLDMPAVWISLPRWSSNGAWIAFTGRDLNARNDVYRTRSDGTNLQRLIRLRHYIQNLQWSPDDEWLLAEASVSGGNELFRLPADGSPVEYIGQGDFASIAPVSGREWHPFWLTSVAALMFLASFMIRFRS